MNLSFSKNMLHPAGAGLPDSERLPAAIVVLMGVCMATLDTAIANTALPTMAADLRATEANSIWVISGYQLAMVAALLPAASLGEIVGHRRVWMWGLLLFTVASLACGLSPSLEWLVVARLFQGLGAAGLMSVNGAMVRFIYPGHLLGRGMGLNSLVVGLAFAAGPTAASLILSWGTWHWLFLINVPIGILAASLGLRLLPATMKVARTFDVPGAVLCGAFLALLVFSLNEAAHSASLLRLLVEFGATAICLALLIHHQSGQTAPILAVDLLRLPVFSLSAATSICSFATQALAFVALPFLFQQRLGYSQIETGFLITAWPVMVAAMAPIAGRMSDRYPAGLLGGVGLAALGIGMLCVAFLPAAPSVFDISWRLAICGAGFGFFQSPNVRALMSAAPPARSGGASGMVGTVRLLGQSTGAALVAACFTLSNASGAQYAIWLGVGFAFMASTASFLRLRFSTDMESEQKLPATR